MMYDTTLRVIYFAWSSTTTACKLLGIKHLNLTAYHHETLGALENSHKHLGAYLRIQCTKYKSILGEVGYLFGVFHTVTSVHTETQYTPYELFGRTTKLPSNIGHSVDPLYNFDNYPL